MRRLLYKLRARRRLGHDVGIWYHPEYTVPALGHTARVSNVEPRRGELIITKLVDEGLLAPGDIRTPPVATVEELARFHPLTYLDRTLSPDMLGRIFGLEPELVGDPDPLLKSARRQVGGTIQAARAAASRRRFFAVNLGGGFHHAEPEQGSGFCVYNDIGVAIQALRDDGYDEPIAIVDLDYHQGNGNTVAFANDPTVMVYSLHGSVWSHVEGTEHEVHLTGSVSDRRYLAALRTTGIAALSRFRPKLVFFIAGTDVLANDRLGSFWLSLDGVLQRDRTVLDHVARMGASAVVTLGGGYSSVAWVSSFHLVRYLLARVTRVEEVPRVSVRTQFAQIASQLDSAELTRETSDLFELTEEDVLGELGGQRRSRKILDFYSKHGLELAFERYGILPAIRKRGFEQLEVEADPSEPPHHMVRVTGVKPTGGPRHVLIELVTHRRWMAHPDREDERVEVLYVEWMLLQDPTRGFTLDRPPLPGQQHPGLGIALEMQELLVQACNRLGLHGVVDRPAHFHNGLGGAEDCFFWEPEDEGRFRAMLTVLAAVSPAESSYLVERHAVRLADGTPVAWEPALHCLPVSETLRGYFGSSEYRRRAREVMTFYLERGLHVVGHETRDLEVGI